MATIRTADLRMAWVFTCEDCGRDTFGNTIVAELSAAERAEMREEGIPVQTGDYVVMPKYVTCTHCRSRFKVVDD